MLNYITYKLFNNKNTFFIFKKCFVFFFFFFCNVFFFSQYFLIVFKTTLAIFECPSRISTSLIFCHDYILFSIVMLYYFNTTFSPCFFCNFYNHFINTHTKKINKIFWWLFLSFYFFYLLLFVFEFWFWFWFFFIFSSS